ncbi:Coronin-like protein crn1, partial [Coemansia sp. RSA 1290]
PVSFRVPRKSESFQSDIYPPAHAGVAALTASEYFAGKSADPVLVDMEQIYRDGPLIAGTNTPISAPKVAPAPAAAAPKQQPAPSKPTQPAVSEPPAAQKPAVQPSESPAPDTSKLDSLHKELEQVRADLEKAQKATFDATAREHTTQEQLKQVQQQLADSQQSEKRLQAMVDSGVSADQLQAVESQLKSAVEDADSLRAELERASAQAESYKVQLAQASARASEHEQTSAGLQKDLQAAIQAANALALAAEKAADSL